MKKTQFEKNGGYFIDGVPYMDCKITGEPVRNVSTDCKEVIGSRALTGLLHKKFPEQSKPAYVPTGRPAGWHWMKEFVDKDGTVYHLGKEQPKLKGTLPPTKVKSVKKKPTKRRTQEQILIDREKEKKAELRKAHQKQKDFLNHKFGE